MHRLRRFALALVLAIGLAPRAAASPPEPVLSGPVLDHPRLRLAIDELLRERPAAAAPHLAAYLAAAPAGDPGRRPALLLSAIAHRELREVAAFEEEVSALEQTADRWGAFARLLVLVDRLDRGRIEPAGDPFAGPEYVTPAAAIDDARLGGLYRLAAATLLAARGEDEAAAGLLATAIDDPELGASAQVLAGALAAGPGLAPIERTLADSLASAEESLRSGAPARAAHSFAAAAAAAARAHARLDPEARTVALAGLAPEDLAERLAPLVDRSPDAPRLVIDDDVITARLVTAIIAGIGVTDEEARARALVGAPDPLALHFAPAPLMRAETTAIARDLATLDDALGRLARARRQAEERAATQAAIAEQRARLEALRAAEARLLTATEIELQATADRVAGARGQLTAAISAATRRAESHLDSLVTHDRELAAAARGLSVLFPPAEPGARPEPAFLDVHRRTAGRDGANLAALDSAFAVVRAALPPLVEARVRGERWPGVEERLAAAESLAIRVARRAGPLAEDPVLMAAAQESEHRLLPPDPLAETERWGAIATRAADRVRATIAEADQAAVDRSRKRLLVLAEAARFGHAEALYQVAQLDRAAPDAGVAALRAAAAAYEDFVAAEPAGPGAAAAWLRVGELRFALAELDFERAMARYDENRRGGTAPGPLPVRDLSGASAAAHAFLDRFPAHPRADRALYNLGVLARDEGDLAASTAHFERLRRERPESPLVSEAALRIGDNHFALGSFAAAEGAYSAITGDPGPLGAAALYKLGWCRLNQNDPAAAAGAFADLLARDVDHEVRADAARTLARCLADLGGAPAAERFFASRTPAAFAPLVFHLLAQELTDRADYPAAVAAARAGAGRHPGAPELEDLLTDEITALDRAGRNGAAARARLDFARQVGPGTSWFSAHGSDSLAIRSARVMLTGADQLVALAGRAAGQAGSRADLIAAHAAYREYLALFPGSTATDRAELMSAECEMALGDPRAAARSYARALATTTDSTRARVAAYGAVVAWAEARGPAPDGAPDLEAEIAAIDTFAGRFGADENVPAVLMRRGAITGNAGLCDESLASYATLLALHPASAYRIRALRARGDAALRCEQPERAAGIYAELLQECESSPRGNRTADAAVAAADRNLCTEAETLLPVALFRSAEALAAAGDSVGAARTYADVARRFTEFAQADLALLRAGDTARRAGDLATAAMHYRELATRYPGSANRGAALLRQAAVAAAGGDSSAAAREYLRFAADYPRAEESAPALAEARHLARSTGDWALLETAARAEITWRSAGRGEASPAAELDLATALIESGRNDAARAELDRMLLAPAGATTLTARAHLMRARLALPDYDRIALTPPLAASIGRKKAALAGLLADLEPAARSDDADVALLARELLGSALAEFGRALVASDLPPDLEGADLVTYSQDVAAQADAFYRRAETAWRQAVTEAAHAGLEHSASALAREKLFHRYDQRYAEMARPAFGAPPAPASMHLARSAGLPPTPTD